MGARNWPDYPRAGFPRLACPLFPLASICIQKNTRMKPTPLQFLALHPPARGSRRQRENIPANMIRRFLDGEARAWKHSTLAGALWETGVRASRAIATAEKFFSAPQNKSCADSAHATNSPCRQYGGTVPAEPGKPIENEKMKIITCKDLGITGTDADIVMGNSEFISLCEAGERESAYALAFSIINPPHPPAPVREKTEREMLKLRGNDRIEGDEVVIAFKRGREVRMPKTEWTAIVAKSYEPHTIAAKRLP
jgi:hypothetical protein